MDLLEALILGVLQGVKEFLPISSSGHWVLVPWWFGWDRSPLFFDVAIRWGTLFAVLVYFWRDWRDLLRAGLNILRYPRNKDPDTRLLRMIALATIPAAVVGGLLEDLFEPAFLEPSLVAALLLVTALLVFSERYHAANGPFSDFNARDARFVGAAQVVAILPGISRSGSMFSAGIVRGLPRTAAARFSCLLAAPILFGVGVKQAVDSLLTDETLAKGMESAMAVGFISPRSCASCVSGCSCGCCVVSQCTARCSAR